MTTSCCPAKLSCSVQRRAGRDAGGKREGPTEKGRKKGREKGTGRVTGTETGTERAGGWAGGRRLEGRAGGRGEGEAGPDHQRLAAGRAHKLLHDDRRAELRLQIRSPARSLHGPRMRPVRPRTLLEVSRAHPHGRRSADLNAAHGSGGHYPAPCRAHAPRGVRSRLHGSNAARSRTRAGEGCTSASIGSDAISSKSVEVMQRTSFEDLCP